MKKIKKLSEFQVEVLAPEDQKSIVGGLDEFDCIHFNPPCPHGKTYKIVNGRCACVDNGAGGGGGTGEYKCEGNCKPTDQALAWNGLQTLLANQS